MDPLPSKARKCVGLGLALFCLLPTGCLPFMKQPEKIQQPELPPSNLHMETGWNNQVVFAPDTVSGGKDMPGLVARVYLFGPDMGVPVLGDGKLFVKLFDVSSKENPVLTNVWEIDPIALRKLAKSDIIGPGYTIFLPWDRYDPAIQRVNMQLWYTPEGKQSVMAQSGPITLDHSVARQKGFKAADSFPSANSLPAPAPAHPPRIPQ